LLRNSVKIVGHDWTLHLPTASGYDREVLLDHLSTAVQSGDAELVAASGTYSIKRISLRAKTKCTRCGGAARRIIGKIGGELLCPRCIWHRVRRRVRRLPKLAVAGF
jgi:hypothetical protein